PQSPGADQRTATSDSTLFLMAAPQLREPFLISEIPFAARFAVPCRSDARGAWVTFAPDEEPFFILVHASGGSGGDVVRVIEHSVEFDTARGDQDRLQNHTFSLVLERLSRGPVLTGEIDQDGFPELLIAGDTRGAKSPNFFRVLKWDRTGRQFEEIR